MDFRMNIGFRFNRPLTERDYLSPGGYVFDSKGKNYSFDFEDSEGWIDNTDKCIAHFEVFHPDKAAFPCIDQITESDLRNISSIIECFIYVGEDDETDLRATELLYMDFDIEGKIISVSDRVLAAWNMGLTKGRNQT